MCHSHDGHVHYHREGDSGALGKPALNGEESCNRGMGTMPQVSDCPEFGSMTLAMNTPLRQGWILYCGTAQWGAKLVRHWYHLMVQHRVRLETGSTRPMT